MEQPVELRDRIASFVDHPRDLLSLALTSKSWRDVIIPGHIELRHIRSSIDNVLLWKTLLERPSLAAGIRGLELIPELEHVDRVKLRPILPRHWLTRISESQSRVPIRLPTNESPAYINELKSLMPYLFNLQGFYWTAVPWQFDLSMETLYETVVQNCPKLDELHLFIPHWGLDHGLSWLIPNISSICILAEDLPDQTLTDTLIVNCTNLKNLLLSEALQGLILHILERATWPHLERLSVMGHYSAARPTSSSEESVALNRFLLRHSKLTRICLPRLDTIENSEKLPHLKSMGTIDRTTFSGKTPPQFLHNLAAAIIYPMQDTACCSRSDLHKLKYACRFLKSAGLYILGWPETESRMALETILSGFGPQIERINLFWKSYKKITVTRKFGKRLLVLFCRLRNLVVLSGLQVCLKLSHPDIGLLLEELAMATKLKQMQVLTENEIGITKMQWICFERDDSGNYNGWHIFEDPLEEPVAPWGEMVDPLSFVDDTDFCGRPVRFLPEK